MYVNEKEFDAIHAALDYIISDADGADDDKYPHDIIDGLNSLFAKAKNDREKVQFKGYVKTALRKLKSK